MCISSPVTDYSQPRVSSVTIRRQGFLPLPAFFKMLLVMQCCVNGKLIKFSCFLLYATMSQVTGSLHLRPPELHPTKTITNCIIPKVAILSFCVSVPPFIQMNFCIMIWSLPLWERWYHFLSSYYSTRACSTDSPTIHPSQKCYTNSATTRFVGLLFYSNHRPIHCFKFLAIHILILCLLIWCFFSAQCINLTLPQKCNIK